MALVYGAGGGASSANGGKGGSFASLNDVAKSNGTGLIKTALQNISAANPAPATTPTTPAATTPSYSGSSSRSSSSSSSATAAPAASYDTSAIESLLRQQYDKADAYYKQMMDLLMSQNEQNRLSQHDSANREYMNMRRRLDSMFGPVDKGNSISGTGLTNRVRNDMNYSNNLANIDKNAYDTEQTIKADYYKNQANALMDYADNWTKYILPYKYTM